ncbi:hypothetical protein INR49_000736 [Caranx melampygus]|nr:hypothetical protein INR49_000736 [Caranx melampygus]
MMLCRKCRPTSRFNAQECRGGARGLTPAYFRGRFCSTGRFSEQRCAAIYWLERKQHLKEEVESDRYLGLCCMLK